MTTLFTAGNSAKLFCLNLIEKIINRQGESLILLDLGCGAAANFIKLLKKHPRLRYVGVEPSSEACEIARKNTSAYNATIINAPAYQLDLEPADIIISFSVLEHVYRRNAYMQAVKKHLKREGVLMINYDSGHFIEPPPAPIWAVGSERWKNRFGGWMARIGYERYFQAFVREDEFHALLNETGLKALDDKFFNTDLKNVYKLIPSQNIDDYMRRWLEFELYLNQMAIRYDDAMSKWFRTRNFVVSHQNADPAAFRWLLNYE